MTDIPSPDTMLLCVGGQKHGERYPACLAGVVVPGRTSAGHHDVDVYRPGTLTQPTQDGGTTRGFFLLVNPIVSPDRWTRSLLRLTLQEKDVFWRTETKA